MDSGEGTRTWTLLSLRSAAAVGALWAWEDAARGNDEDVAIGELLLELTGQTEKDGSVLVLLMKPQDPILTAAGRGAIPGAMELGRK